MLSPPPNMVFSGPELCRLEAHEVVKLLRQGEIEPLDLIKASLSRIEAVEPSVNAMPMVCRERAEKHLEQWRKAPGDSNHPGWLGGLPIGIKDLCNVAGVTTTYGCTGLADNIPNTSDPLVELLERRGGLVMGKTNTPEMGAGGNTFNAVYGRTCNPWNTRLNAGGSSGGAAVSLATGEVWLSHGSDLAGSLRTPAAYCGVVGLRPTPGRAGGGPSELLFHTEGVQGPMARSVMDCALFLDAMSGFNPQSPISYPAPEESFQNAVLRASPKLRIAYSPDLNGFTEVSHEVDEVLRSALQQVQAQGAEIEEACPLLPDLDHCYRVLRAMLWAAGPGYAPESIQCHFKTTLKENIEYGQNLSIEDIYRMQRARSQLFINMHQFLTKYDLLACPTVGLLPGPIEEEYPTQINGQTLGDYIEWLRFSYLSTATSLPSISIPVGFSRNGMPVGLQLIGHARGEAQLLAAARSIEIILGGPLTPIDPVIKG